MNGRSISILAQQREGMDTLRVPSGGTDGKKCTREQARTKAFDQVSKPVTRVKGLSYKLEWNRVLRLHRVFCLMGVFCSQTPVPPYNHRTSKFAMILKNLCKRMIRQ